MAETFKTSTKPPLVPKNNLECPQDVTPANFIFIRNAMMSKDPSMKAWTRYKCWEDCGPQIAQKFTDLWNKMDKTPVLDGFNKQSSIIDSIVKSIHLHGDSSDIARLLHSIVDSEFADIQSALHDVRIAAIFYFKCFL